MYSSVSNGAIGSYWAESTSAAPWPARAYHQAVVYDGKMWILGGVGKSGIYTNDVWFSVAPIRVTKLNDLPCMLLLLE